MASIFLASVFLAFVFPVFWVGVCGLPGGGDKELSYPAR